MKTTMTPAILALATAALTTLGTGATASAALANGSFEADPLGTTIAPSGWGRQGGVSSEIVDGTVSGVPAGAITDGTKAVRISATVNNGGVYQALEQYFTPPAANAAFVVGQDYEFFGDVTFISSDNPAFDGVSFNLFESDTTNFGYGNQIAHGTGNAGANAGTVRLGGTFTYRGGDLGFQIQADDYSGTPTSFVAIIDNVVIRPVVIPEPAALGLLAAGSVLGLRRRRA